MNNPQVPIYKSYSFLVLVAGFVVFVFKYYQPDFPFTTLQVLSVILFVLGAVNIRPEPGSLRATDVFGSLAFWLLISGLIAFLITFFRPDLQVTSEGVLGLILYVLAIWKIKPQIANQTLR